MDVTTIVSRLAEEQVEWLIDLLGYGMFQFLDYDLTGYCAISALRLHRRMIRRGIKSKIAFNSGHAFNIFQTESGEELILDCTATQFGFQEEILIFTKEEAETLSIDNLGYNVWDVESAYRSESWCVKRMLNDGWPMNQIYSSL